MKSVMFILLALFAVFLSAGNVSAGGGGGGGGDVMVMLTEADMKPSSFMPFSAARESNSAKGFSFYLQDSWTISDKFTINYGKRLEWDDLFPIKLQEVSTNYKPVGAADNKDWMAGVDSYFQGRLDGFVEGKKGKKTSGLDLAAKQDSWGFEQSVPKRLDYLSEEEEWLLELRQRTLENFKRQLQRQFTEPSIELEINAETYKFISSEDAGLAMALMLVHQTMFAEAYEAYWQNGPEVRDKIMKSVLVHWARVKAETAKPRR